MTKNIIDWIQAPIQEVPCQGQSACKICLSSNDFKAVQDCTDPTQLMLIKYTQQLKWRFTIDEMKGVPMYKEIMTDEGSSNDEGSTATANEPKKRKNKESYTSRRIIAPPEYPFTYCRLKKDQKSPHCGGIGKDCDNICYGGYLTAIVGHFHNEHPDEYNEHDAKFSRMNGDVGVEQKKLKQKTITSLVEK